MRTFSARNAATLRPAQHQHDNFLLAKRFGRTAATYFPFYAFVLGWPVSVYSSAKLPVSANELSVSSSFRPTTSASVCD